jgi:ATP/maltotriose-dependent transcriptional regulator MalT
VSLDELEVGEQQLQQAFRLFSQLQMEAQIPRTIAGLAKLQYKRGNLRDAIATFHFVYADLLHHGLMIPAAQVQVELMDIVTELTNDLEYARHDGARLAATFTDYEAPGNVVAMMAYVRDEASTASSVSEVRSALGRAKAFLSDVLASPSSAFVLPS